MKERVIKNNTWERFEDTKGITKTRNSKKNRKYNSKKKTNKRTISDLQNNNTLKTKDRATQTPLNTGGHLGCFGWEISSCSISSTRPVTLVTNSCPSRFAARNSFVSYHTLRNPQLLLKHLRETNQTYTHHSTRNQVINLLSYFF